MTGAVEIEVGEERRMLEVRVILRVGFERGVPAAVDEQLESFAVGENRGLLAGSARRLWTEVPEEIGCDDRTDFLITLREIKRRAEFRDAKAVSDARALHVVVGIDEAR